MRRITMPRHVAARATGAAGLLVASVLSACTSPSSSSSSIGVADSGTADDGSVASLDGDNPSEGGGPPDATPLTDGTSSSDAGHTADGGPLDGARSDGDAGTTSCPSCVPDTGAPLDSDWPSVANRPTVSGETLSWTGPLGGGANDGHPVRQSVALTASGSVTTSSDGQVIQGLDVSGTVRISNNNVTLRQCRISVSSYWAISVDGGMSGVTIEDVEVDGQNGSTDGMTALYVGVTGSSGACPNLTIRRSNVHGACDGMSIGYGPVLFQDNWVHDLATSGAGHINGIQWNGASTGGLIDVEHNHIENANNQTDALMFDDFYTGTFGNYTINDNLLRGGGDFTLYSTNSFNHTPPTNITITNNILNKTSPAAADYLYPTDWASTTYSNNVAEETGAQVQHP
jgi:hypothetical protein